MTDIVDNLLVFNHNIGVELLTGINLLWEVHHRWRCV
jgi:hypothetical protein